MRKSGVQRIESVKESSPSLPNVRASLPAEREFAFFMSTRAARDLLVYL